MLFPSSCSLRSANLSTRCGIRIGSRLRVAMRLLLCGMGFFRVVGVPFLPESVYNDCANGRKANVFASVQCIDGSWSHRHRPFGYCASQAAPADQGRPVSDSLAEFLVWLGPHGRSLPTYPQL
ncbi:hypothetical protein BJY01DRAFT_209273, partial [Aspergillus pseudoustus]